MANLEFAQIGGWLSSDFPDPVEAYGFLVPETFKIYFLIEDSEFDRRWSVELEVKILEAGTASALSVTTRGFTNAKSFRKNLNEFDDLQPVERWQLETTRIQLGDLLVISLGCAIEFFRYSGTKEDWSIPLKVSRASLDSRGSWELGSRGENSKELRKQIEKFQDRRAISQEEHLITARLVAEEVARAKSTKSRSRHNIVVSDYFGLGGSKGGQYRVKQAREAGYLTKDNKVSTPKVGRKKKK
jgi:hypothetical protein